MSDEVLGLINIPKICLSLNFQKKYKYIFKNICYIIFKFGIRLVPFLIFFTMFFFISNERNENNSFRFVRFA